MTQEKYRILSLDGGGIRGVLSARLLKEVEDILAKKGHKLHTYFDFVAGTSTGSILAAGIACQKSAQQMIELYEKQGKNIFLDSVRQQRKWRGISQLFGDRIQQFLTKPWGIKVLYPNGDEDQGLAKVLKEELGDRKLREIEAPHILIPAYDVYSRNTTWFCNNSPDEDESWYDNIELWKICAASASAPTFFPPYKLPYYPDKNPDQNKNQHLPHIDGGVSANNPALIAIARALELNQELNLSNIAVLSIGTGKTTRPYKHEEIEKWGLASWAKNISNIFMDPSAINSEEICRRIVRIQGGSYLRLNFDLNTHLKGERKENHLRELLDKKDAYNEFMKTYVSEEIDDPSKCNELIKAAECYLEKGKVYEYKYKEKKDVFTGVKEAIEDFINTNPKPISNPN
ncbi:patatin-like phospholipase family protein [Dapis sp. BLCC M229]|uniref:patatin-like phospholipase family protein n=1 Tax=Dapis sp. BLCC M229 TaxID=3400188 RepID=UPI003CF0BFAF